jgi:hypothetical protein
MKPITILDCDLAEILQCLIDANALLADYRRHSGMTPDPGQNKRVEVIQMARESFFPHVPSNMPVFNESPVD